MSGFGDRISRDINRYFAVNGCRLPKHVARIIVAYTLDRITELTAIEQARTLRKHVPGWLTVGMLHDGRTLFDLIKQRRAERREVWRRRKAWYIQQAPREKVKAERAKMRTELRAEIRAERAQMKADIEAERRAMLHDFEREMSRRRVEQGERFIHVVQNERIRVRTWIDRAKRAMAQRQAYELRTADRIVAGYTERWEYERGLLHERIARLERTLADAAPLLAGEARVHGSGDATLIIGRTGAVVPVSEASDHTLTELAQILDVSPEDAAELQQQAWYLAGIYISAS